jgi:hypothetical protein
MTSKFAAVGVFALALVVEACTTLPVALGPPGPAGSAGPSGPPGLAGIVGYEIVEVKGLSDSTDSKTTFARCPPGKSVLGGGGSFSGPSNMNSFLVLTVTMPKPAGTLLPTQSAWLVKGMSLPRISPSDEWSLNAYAVCGTVTP